MKSTNHAKRRNLPTLRLEHPALTLFLGGAWGLGIVANALIRQLAQLLGGRP